MKDNKKKDTQSQVPVDSTTMPRLGNIPLKLDRETLIQGFVFSEILGKPKAKRKRR